MGELKEFKSGKLDNSKFLLEQIHAQLKHTRGLQADLVNLSNIEVHLPPKQRELFVGMAHHGPVLRVLQALNQAFLPILEFQIAYKPELGLALQRLVESYNLLMLDQFEGYYQTDRNQKQEHAEHLRVVKEQTDLVH
jgi:hypothetical protein